MVQSRSMIREIGTALAVLAIYLLTILAPMHQARASQLAFQELGYETLETGWVLCTPDGVTSDDSDVKIAKCPAAGIGKDELIAPSLGPVLATIRLAEIAAAPIAQPALVTPRPIAPPSGPRAPPVTV